MDKQPPKSSFLRFALGFTLCSLILCGGFTAFIFGTDAVVDTTLMNVADLYKTNNNAKITVASKKTTEDSAGDITQSGVNIPGVSGSSSSTHIQLSASAKEVEQKLSNSPYAAKATSLAAVWDAVHTLCAGSNIDVTGFACGLMANLAAEGNYGLVESFFTSGQVFGFKLPSGSKSTMNTIADIDYCYNWSVTNDEPNQPYTSSTNKVTMIQKGSCGVGSVQWSFTRRRTFLSIAKKYMATDADINTNNWMLAEVEMITTELNLAGSYMSEISKALNSYGASTSNATPALWARAIMLKYEAPSSKNTTDRESKAEEIYNIIK